MTTVVTKRQTDDLMKGVIPRAVLLVAPVIEALQRQLAERFPLLRLYEQNDPIVFLREQGENIVIMVTRGDVGVTNGALESLPWTGLIAIFGVGTDAVDLTYARLRQIAVIVTPGVLTNDVVDLAMELLLVSSRQLCQSDRFVREERQLSGSMPLAARVSGRRIGLPGMRSIDRAIIRRARGFDVQMLYTDCKRIAGLDYQWCAGLHTLAHESDFLMITASGGEANHGIIDASVLNAIPVHAQFINIARGSLVDEKALVHTLQNGAIAGAGLDVFEQEPQVPAALITLDSVMLQPHIASATQETRQKMGEVVFANVTAWFADTTLPSAID